MIPLWKITVVCLFSYFKTYFVGFLSTTCLNSLMGICLLKLVYSHGTRCFDWELVFYFSASLQ